MEEPYFDKRCSEYRLQSGFYRREKTPLKLVLYTPSIGTSLIEHANERQLSEFFRGFWPIVAQNSRQRAVGEQFPARLALRAIVGFIRRITNALNFCATARARLLVSTMHRHAFAKGRDFFRKLISRCCTQTLRPVPERLTRGLVKPLEFLTLESQCQHRRCTRRSPIERIV